MSIFGMGLGSIIAQALLAAATGGASLTLTMVAQQVAKQVAMQVVQQLIQQVGQEMGLPQAFIDMAKMAVAQEAGMSDFGPESLQGSLDEIIQGFNMSPSQAGQFAREMDQIEQNFSDPVRGILDNMMKKQAEEEGDSSSVGSGSGSVLMRIARAMGKLMDEKMNAMAAKGDQLGRLGDSGALTKKGNFNAQGQSQYGKLSNEMQALGQELSLLSQAANNALKSIGEASSTMARKN